MPPSRAAESKGDLAYRELRRRILAGELAPGSRLRQDELAAELGMSVTPLREAVRRLASEHWLDIDSHRDVHVAPLSSAEAQHLLEARLALEPVATALAAQRRTDADLEAMTAACERLLPVNRTWGEEAVRAHRDFHRAVYSASHNTVMVRLLDEVWDASDRYRRVGLELPAGDDPRMLDLLQHQRLLELLTAGDGPAAADLARDHIAHGLSVPVTRALAAREESQPGRSRRMLQAMRGLSRGSRTP